MAEHDGEEVALGCGRYAAGTKKQEVIVIMADNQNGDGEASDHRDEQWIEGVDQKGESYS